ncbi:hypothetical protein OIU77_009784 [Salix suchowensis]|uniref:Uncharacterized protein n=1 Tax=Salix suchowensis TaxID=1278906 RepID=A0ABQ9A631_9ROSI|nr:hypothetical protein OIU77_009784 [Salix suchowensis]
MEEGQTRALKVIGSLALIQCYEAYYGRVPLAVLSPFVSSVVLLPTVLGAGPESHNLKANLHVWCRFCFPWKFEEERKGDLQGCHYSISHTDLTC